MRRSRSEPPATFRDRAHADDGEARPGPGSRRRRDRSAARSSHRCRAFERLMKQSRHRARVLASLARLLDNRGRSWRSPQRHAPRPVPRARSDRLGTSCPELEPGSPHPRCAARGASNPARWGTLHSGRPLHSANPCAAHLPGTALADGRLLRPARRRGHRGSARLRHPVGRAWLLRRGRARHHPVGRAWLLRRGRARHHPLGRAAPRARRRNPLRAAPVRARSKNGSRRRSPRSSASAARRPAPAWLATASARAIGCWG